MIFDYENLMSEDQAETTIAAHDSDNIIDSEVIGDAIDQLRLHLQVTETVTSAGAATVQFKLISDSDSGFATTPVTHLDSGAIAKGTLVAGYYPFGAGTRIPNGMQRFHKVTYTIATAVLTAGKFTAGYVMNTQNNTL